MDGRSRLIGAIDDEGRWVGSLRRVRQGDKARRPLRSSEARGPGISSRSGGTNRAESEIERVEVGRSRAFRDCEQIRAGRERLSWQLRNDRGVGPGDQSQMNVVEIDGRRRRCPEIHTAYVQTVLNGVDVRIYDEQLIRGASVSLRECSKGNEQAEQSEGHAK